MSQNVFVTHPLIEGGLSQLHTHYNVRVAETPCSPQQLTQELTDADALICLLSVPVTADLLEGAPRLKIVANYAVGYDNVDVEAAAARGIYVTNTPGVLTEATADLAWAALLALVRRVVPGDTLVRTGEFSGWGPTLLLGSDLAGKTLGVVGLGQIGRAVARRAAGFRMRVLYHSRSTRGPVDLDPGQAQSATLEELLRQSDVVSLHTPLTSETHHLLDAQRLALLKPSAYLVNTARGPVVDEQALVTRLSEGQLAGAALDVYEHEPQLTPGLAQLPNVVLLPHLGSATRETRLRMAQMVAEDVHAALQGNAPPRALRLLR